MWVPKLISAPAVLLAAGLAFTPPASAEPGASINSISRRGCTLYVNTTFGDAGTYYLDIFDDGVLVSGVGFEVDAGETVDLPYTITSSINQGTAGIGIYIKDVPDVGPTVFDREDPFDFPGSAQVSSACARSEGVDSGEAPVVDIASSPATIVEGQAPGSLTVTRDIPGYALEVPLVFGGTAVAGNDVAALPATVVIPEGETSVTIPVQAIDDHVSEPDRPLVASLGPSDEPPVDVGVFVPGQRTATTILITDPPVVPPPVVPPPAVSPTTTTTEPETTTTTAPATTTSERVAATGAPFEYRNCDAVRAAGADPITPGSYGWSERLDGDHDGIGCEVAAATAARPATSAVTYAG